MMIVLIKKVVLVLVIIVLYLIGIKVMESFNLNAFLLNDLEDLVHTMKNLGMDWEKDNLASKGILTTIFMTLHANYRLDTLGKIWDNFW